MGVTSPRMPPNVPIKPRTDVPQLVVQGDHFLPQRKIGKSRQIDAEDIQHLDAALVVELLDGVFPPPPLTDRGALLEPQRRQGGVNPVVAALASTGKRKRHAR